MHFQNLELFFSMINLKKIISARTLQEQANMNILLCNKIYSLAELTDNM